MPRSEQGCSRTQPPDFTAISAPKSRGYSQSLDVRESPLFLDRPKSTEEIRLAIPGPSGTCWLRVHVFMDGDFPSVAIKCEGGQADLSIRDVCADFIELRNQTRAARAVKQFRMSKPHALAAKEEAHG